MPLREKQFSKIILFTLSFTSGVRVVDLILHWPYFLDSGHTFFLIVDTVFVTFLLVSLILYLRNGGVGSFLTGVAGAVQIGLVLIDPDLPHFIIDPALFFYTDPIFISLILISAPMLFTVGTISLLEYVVESKGY